MEEDKLSFEGSEEETKLNPLEMPNIIEDVRILRAEHTEDVVVSSKGSNNQQQNMQIVLDYSSQFSTDEVFKSRESIIKWVRDVGRNNRFLVIIKTSDAGTHTKKPRLTFGCERGGKYVIPKHLNDVPLEKRRKTGTKKCDCPFLLKGRKLDNDDDWRLVVVCGVHNHDMLDYEEGHSFAGRLSSEESNLVVELSKCMVQPKVIFNALKTKMPSNVSNMKVIYNARHRLKVVEKAGRSNMQLLMSKVCENKYLEFRRSCVETNALLDLFFAHPYSVELLRTYPRVLIMDCTYKTNRFNVPLFEIVGMTSTMKTFSVAFAFIENEKEDNYRWALESLKKLMDGCELPQVIVTDRELALMNAIEKVFPEAKHMLCTWHIEKNIATNCKKCLGSKKMWDKFNTAWNMIVYSTTEEDYNHNVTTLRRDFVRFPDAVDYVMDSWLPYKERFVAAWTDRYMHFGNTTSNRVESQHSKLKKQLGTSQHNYEMVWMAIDASLLSQHTVIKESFEKSKMVLPHLYRPTRLFEHLFGQVSISALDLIFQETKTLESIGKGVLLDAALCGCEVRRTHGLPCAHEIAEYNKQGCAIPLDSIDVHWKRLSILPLESEKSGCEAELELLLNRYNSLSGSAQLHFKQKMIELGEPSRTLLMEPQVKKNTRGRRKGGKNGKVDKSTKREPSAFEYVGDFDFPIENPILESTCNSKQKKKKVKVQPPPKVHCTRASCLPPSLEVKQDSERFKHSFPSSIRPYIDHVINVVADGNCGFRVVAALVGYGANEWLRVREELLEELHQYDSHYLKILIGGQYEEIEQLLQWSDTTQCAPEKFWMIMPTMGHLIASRYNVVVYYISSSICCTLLPLRTAPVPMERRKEIAIGYVNLNHFVQLFMKPGHPVPPIVWHWDSWSWSISKGWATPYTERINEWKQQINPELNKRTRIDVCIWEDDISY